MENTNVLSVSTCLPSTRCHNCTADCFENYLLTYSLHTTQSFLRTDQSLQPVKKLPAFLWNPKVSYRTHKCPPPVPILSQLLPVPTTPFNFLKIHLIIILPSTSGSPQWPLSLMVSHQH